MGQARELMDRATEAILGKDFEALDGIYAEDVVVSTPDVGLLRGVEAVKDWHRVMLDAFPDMRFEMQRALEDGDCAIDQGIVHGINTGPMRLPDGTELPPTGRALHLRAMDVIEVAGGRIRSHDFYFDQVSMLTQLGLLEKEAPGTTV